MAKKQLTKRDLNRVAKALKFSEKKTNIAAAVLVDGRKGVEVAFAFECNHQYVSAVCGEVLAEAKRSPAEYLAMRLHQLIEEFQEEHPDQTPLADTCRRKLKWLGLAQPQ